MSFCFFVRLHITSQDIIIVLRTCHLASNLHPTYWTRLFKQYIQISVYINAIATKPEHTKDILKENENTDYNIVSYRSLIESERHESTWSTTFKAILFTIQGELLT